MDRPLTNGGPQEQTALAGALRGSARQANPLRLRDRPAPANGAGSWAGAARRAWRAARERLWAMRPLALRPRKIAPEHRSTPRRRQAVAASMLKSQLMLDIGPKNAALTPSKERNETNRNGSMNMPG